MGRENKVGQANVRSQRQKRINGGNQVEKKGDSLTSKKDKTSSGKRVPRGKQTPGEGI